VKGEEQKEEGERSEDDKEVRRIKGGDKGIKTEGEGEEQLQQT
jgi:hypothetical protein